MSLLESFTDIGGAFWLMAYAVQTGAVQVMLVAMVAIGFSIGWIARAVRPNQ